MEYRYEDLAGLKIAVSPAHKFGTDAFLLANFCRVRGGETACDLGTGCGIIPMLWLRGDPRPALAYGVEIQQEAHDQLLATVAANGLEQVLLPRLGDLRDKAVLPPAGSCHLVSANPPYQAAGTGLLCPDNARRLARHEELCSLEDICGAAARLLRYGGRFCVCQKPERLCDVLEAMRRADLEPKRLRFVQQRPDKAPWLFLCEGRRGGKPFLTLEPPLVVEAPGGGFSQEMLGIYGKLEA